MSNHSANPIGLVSQVFQAHSLDFEWTESSDSDIATTLGHSMQIQLNGFRAFLAPIGGP